MNEGEILFKGNKIDLEVNEKISKQGQFEKEIASISQLQANKKFLGVAKTRLWFYNVASRRKPNKFRFWMKNKVGEPPVLYDSLMVIRSMTLMENFLNNKGYLYPEISYSVRFIPEKERKRVNKSNRQRALVTYQIRAGDLYRIRFVKFPQENSPVNTILANHKDESFLKQGDPFDVGELKKERDRISDLLRNEGYYMFNREYVYFDLDSNNERLRMDVLVKINQPSDTVQHQLFFIDSVYVFTDYSMERLRFRKRQDTLRVKEFSFISEKLFYRPRTLVSAIHFGQDSLFRRSNHNYSVSHLSDLGVFKYVNIEYTPKLLNDKNYLDARVYLSPAKRQAASIEFEANNNTDFNLGTILTLSYLNRNIFRGTERFSLSVSGGFESNLERGENFFNTVDLLFRFDLFFNKFLLPFRIPNIAKTARPKTRISFRNEFLRRIEYYSTNSTSIALGYEWNKPRSRKHFLNPLVVNLVRILQSTSQFQEIINRSPSLRNSFTQQLILGVEYNFLWTNQSFHKGNSFFYYIGKVNSSGNFMHLFGTLINRNSGREAPYELFNVEYSQYFLVDSDIRNYYKISKGSQLVSRLYGGIGVPYGNSRSLTYIKQFFSGGANSMRGWRIRALGPGSFNFEESDIYSQVDQFFFDQTGEIKIEANLEYRFDVYRFVKAALFLDMGNIWLIRADTSRPGANFDITRVWDEIAIGTGFGLRFDFSYFVMRLDLGIKVREPASGKPTWPIRNIDFTDRGWRRENMRFNLAIGYPF